MDNTEAPLPYFGTPPPRVPRQCTDEPALRGKRVILSRPDGFVYDVRAVSELEHDASGRQVVEVMTEEDYFRWMLIGDRRSSQTFPARLVWVE